MKILLDSHITRPSEMRLSPTDTSRWQTAHYFRPVLSAFGDLIEAEDANARARLARQASRRGNTCLYVPFMLPGALPDIEGLLTVPAFDWTHGATPDYGADGCRRERSVLLSGVTARILHSEQARSIITPAADDDIPTVVVPAPVWDHFADSRARAATDSVTPRRMTLVGNWLDSSAGHTTVSTTESRSVTLEGVVFGAVFDPDDASSHWPDLVQAFCWAFRDQHDVTLIITLNGPSPTRSLALIRAELDKLPVFRSRVIALAGDQPRQTCHAVMEGCDFFVTASGGEGQCLPLLEFMSAGKPCVAPWHSGLAEHLTAANSLPVSFFRTWSAGPYDDGSPLRTYLHAVNWQSLVDACVQACSLRSSHTEQYLRMAEACREHTRQHCSQASAMARLAPLFAQLEALPATTLTGKASRWLHKAFQRF
jgi:hypothetical protein